MLDKLRVLAATPGSAAAQPIPAAGPKASAASASYVPREPMRWWHRRPRNENGRPRRTSVGALFTKVGQCCSGCSVVYTRLVKERVKGKQYCSFRLAQQFYTTVYPIQLKLVLFGLA